MSKPLIIAVPKGRILEEVLPLFEAVDIKPEAAFFDKECRQLRFATNHQQVEIIRVRSFDVATFVTYGAAHIGFAGRDVLMEFDYPELYVPLDLGIGKCRLSVAESRELANEDDPAQWSHIHIATKYVNITRKYFAKRGVQAECIKLNGAMELAPDLGLCRRIVDLVGTGKTLQENGLVEVETIAEISSCLIINRTAYKTRTDTINHWIESFKEKIDG